jgi:hypothetical protein
MVLGAVLSSSVVELMLFGDENTYLGRTPILEKA